MNSSAPVPVIVHFPRAEDGRRELARRVAEVHADFVLGAIQTRSGPRGQKLELLQAVMDAAQTGRDRSR